MRPPKNLIIEDQYTSGNEFLTEFRYENYAGFYHSVAGKQYVGAKYNPKATSLIAYTDDKIKTAFEINNIDKTYLNLKPGVTNLIKNDNVIITRFTYYPTKGKLWRYFIKKSNEVNSPIIEVTKDTYLKVLSNPFYKTTAVFWDPSEIFLINLYQNEQELPGISKFLGLS